MVHQSFGPSQLGQSGGQQAVVSVHDGQALVLQLNPQRSEALLRLYACLWIIGTLVSGRKWESADLELLQFQLDVGRRPQAFVVHGWQGAAHLDR